MIITSCVFVLVEDSTNYGTKVDNVYIVAHEKDKVDQEFNKMVPVLNLILQLFFDHDT